jgi:hypothetical protein
MKLPKSPNIEKWENALERKLTKFEKKILKNADVEIYMNNCIKDLINNLKNDNLYIPKLSITNGNCFYDSVSYHLDNIKIKELKSIISDFLKTNKDTKNLFHNYELSLNEMFEIQNEIEEYHDKTNDTIQKYTYDNMCIDIENNYSWKRTPMEIILLCISYIFNAKIIICHNNGYVHDICSINNPTKFIYIGLLNEFHYIPLEIKKENDPEDIADYIIIYNDDIDKYNNWRKQQKEIYNQSIKS